MKATNFASRSRSRRNTDHRTQPYAVEKRIYLMRLSLGQVQRTYGDPSVGICVARIYGHCFVRILSNQVPVTDVVRPRGVWCDVALAGEGWDALDARALPTGLGRFVPDPLQLAEVTRTVTVSI
jgi:hypothetical protein